MLLAASVMAWGSGASAAPSCQGTYAATSLQPLPDRVVVDLDIRDRSPRNLMLADRFLKGVREAGVAVGQGGERATAREVRHDWEKRRLRFLAVQNGPIPS